MSCPDREALSIYADGELELPRQRELESHLVQCRRCRAQVLALREESAVLRDLLHGHDRAPLHAVPPRERARGLAVGAAPVLGVAALVASVAGWLLETNLPAGTSWLNPLHLMGTVDMVFETIFMLRDRAPGLVEGAIAVGALFSVAAILTFLAGSLSRRLAGSGMALLVLGPGALTATPARAILFELDVESLVVEAGESITETVVVSAKRVRIDGEIEGDLYALAEEVSISGKIDGNAFVVGENVEITGEIDDSLYVGAERVRLEGETDDLYGFSDDLGIHERAVVERDATIYAERARLDGRAGRDVSFFSRWLAVRGEIGRNLFTRGREVEILDGASIGGDFESWIRDGRQADVAPGASIAGERKDAVVERHHDRGSKWQDAGFYARSLILMISAFLVGMALHAIRPGLFESALPTASDFFRELGFGFVTLVVAPIAILLCFLTVVAIPIGVVALFVLVTGLFLSMILVAGLVGGSLLGHDETARGFGTSLLLGLLIVTIAVNLPFVGGLIWIVAVTTGLGMLVVHVHDSYRMRVG